MQRLCLKYRRGNSGSLALFTAIQSASATLAGAFHCGTNGLRELVFIECLVAPATTLRWQPGALAPVVSNPRRGHLICARAAIPQIGGG